MLLHFVLYSNSEVMAVSDEDLLQMLLTQPERGCEQLLRQYTGLVLSICRNKLGGCCTDEDIEELASDILFAFWQRRDQISLQKGSIRALLSVMTVRRCIDRYRSAENRAQKQTQPLDSVALTAADPTPDPERQTVSQEQREALYAAVRALGEPDTEIVVRKYFYGETAANIARRLSMRTGAVEMRLSRARQKLRAMLEGGDGYDA